MGILKKQATGSTAGAPNAVCSLGYPIDPASPDTVQRYQIKCTAPFGANSPRWTLEFQLRLIFLR
jgi:hypothetical protein